MDWTLYLLDDVYDRVVRLTAAMDQLARGHGHTVGLQSAVMSDAPADPVDPDAPADPDAAPDDTDDDT